MPEYLVTDKETGLKLRLTGDSPPTEQELEEIFASRRNDTTSVREVDEFDSRVTQQEVDEVPSQMNQCP